jgi:hypothetical protein
MEEENKSIWRGKWKGRIPPNLTFQMDNVTVASFPEPELLNV